MAPEPELPGFFRASALAPISAAQRRALPETLFLDGLRLELSLDEGAHL